MDNAIVEVKFNTKAPSKYDYKYFEVVLKNGDIERFYHHKNNPIPTKEEMIGSTWSDLCELIKIKWYEAIESV